MKIVYLKNEIGDFAENKEIAKRIRYEDIFPALKLNKTIAIDFEGVSGATQSFIHALISDAIRDFYDVVFDNIIFVNTNDEIKNVIRIVYRYIQESIDGGE